MYRLFITIRCKCRITTKLPGVLITSIGSIIDYLQANVSSKFADYFKQNSAVLKIKGDVNAPVYVNINEVPYGEQVKKDSGRLIGTKLGENRFQFIRKDLLPEVEELFKFRQQLKKDDLLKILDKRHKGMALRAYKIVYLEKKGKHKEAEKHLKSFRRCYKDDGKKIYNMVRSGVFEPLLTSMITDLQQSKYSDKNIKIYFNQLFNKILEYNPYCIWVNSGTTKRYLLREMRRRLIKDRVEIIGIWGRGEDNILMITDAISNFTTENQGFNFDQEIHKVRNVKAVAYYIKKI